MSNTDLPPIIVLPPELEFWVQRSLEAVKMMSPKMIIPCRYDCGALLSRKLNQEDADIFQREVEKMGIECIIMKYGDEIIV